jgi:acyl transferase domain-containing protein
MTFQTACNSSRVAVHLVMESLRRGESTMALAGGVHTMISPHATVAMTRFGAMNPEGQCRSIDADANGYRRGEGGGVGEAHGPGTVLGDPLEAGALGATMTPPPSPTTWVGPRRWASPLR